MWTATFRTEMRDPGHHQLDLLFHPGRRYERPADVLADPELSLDERRAILSSWASDACAVDSAPALRRPPFAPAPVCFDEVMDALQELDRETGPRREKELRQLRGQPAASA